MTKSNAFLFFWKANFMYIGKGIQTAIHDHHAIQLIIDLDGEFELQSRKDGNKKLQAVLINSDSQHECITNDDTMLIINIEPESAIGSNLKKNYLNEADFQKLTDKSVHTFIKELVNHLNNSIDEKSVVAMTDSFLYNLSKTHAPLLIDDRITKALDFLAATNNATIRIGEVAEKVFLSESRLIHLFTEQVGVPIRKYFLWLRLIKAIQRTFQDTNITQAALDAGFSDAPHFNKTLKRMFGLNLSNLKNSQNIKAFWV